MRPRLYLRIVLVTIATLIAACAVLTAAEKPPKFTAEDHKTIDAYYKGLYADIAPGSISRATFSSEIERALKPGEKLPLQLQKKLESLPRELEVRISAPPAGYAIYKLGHHVLILRRSDLEIEDIIKDAGLAANEY
jgi:hypothetical protein